MTYLFQKNNTVEAIVVEEQGIFHTAVLLIASGKKARKIPG